MKFLCGTRLRKIIKLSYVLFGKQNMKQTNVTKVNTIVERYLLDLEDIYIYIYQHTLYL